MVANPFGFIKYHDVLVEKLRDSCEGFLAGDQMVLTVNIKNIREGTAYPLGTLGDDMRFINVEVFGKSAITSRLKEGSVFGIVSKLKSRSSIVTANHLIRQFVAWVSILDIFIRDSVRCTEKMAPLVVRTIFRRNTNRETLSECSRSRRSLWGSL